MALSKKDIIKIIGKESPDTLDEHIKIVEYRMGMSVDEFHRKIQEVITPEYIAEGERNYEIVKDWIETKKSITTWKKEEQQELILLEDEYFTPCFCQNESVRNELPNYWFVSNKGNIVTVINGKVYWKKSHPYEDGSGRSSYKPINYITGKHISIMTYNLLWSVFNRNCIFGRAKDYVDQFGSYAFGVKGDPFNVEGHHKERVEHYPERINDPSDIQVITVYAHNVLRKIREMEEKIRLEDSEEKKRNLRNEITKLVSELQRNESPEQSIMINNGERYNNDGSFKDDKGVYDYSKFQPDEALYSPLALQQITLLRHGNNVHEQIRKAIEIIGIEGFTEEQIIVIKYKNGDELPFTVIKTDENHVDIKFVPASEVDGKEVYVYEAC